MSSAHDVPETGELPGRFEWIEEPDGALSIPSDPSWNRFSDTMRGWTATSGATPERNDALGTADAKDHSRGTEEPEATIAYDLMRFPVDGSGDPQGAEAYGMLRDSYNQFHSTLLCVGRQELPGGDHDAGLRTFTVIRGCVFATVTATLDPSEANPILMELEAEPAKVRSYAIHQPSSATTVSVSSTDSSADSGITATIESEDAAESEDVDMGQTSTTEFDDIDAIWLDGEPEGDITVDDGSSDTFATLIGGNTYSDDDQAVDGDRGVPALGTGSHASAIDGTKEHFVGDRFERPVGTAVRPRINSASWTIENSIAREPLRQTRAPTIDPGSRTAQVEADVGGPKASHDSIMESLRGETNHLEHELSSGTIKFHDMVVLESYERNLEADDQAAAQGTETFEASGSVITLTSN